MTPEGEPYWGDLSKLGQMGDVDGHLPALSVEEVSPDYYAGYMGVARELSRAMARGFRPTERQLALGMTQAARIYSAAQGGKPVGGRSPEWLRGRVDGLRALIRKGVAARPQAE